MLALIALPIIVKDSELMSKNNVPSVKVYLTLKIDFRNKMSVDSCLTEAKFLQIATQPAFILKSEPLHFKLVTFLNL